ncbi:MAG: ATP-binding protein [Atopobiaceae bacterium]
MATDFYPFVENPGAGSQPPALEVHYAARIAVYDDAAAAPRVVVVEPKDVRAYLEEITSEVTRLSHEQGGTIPFMVIREIVENFIHAYFMEPTVSILDGGMTIRFSDQGPGIQQKGRALEYGTSSATEEMRRYIRGVGSGLPYAQQYMADKGGTLEIADNIGHGTIVTISMKKSAKEEEAPAAQNRMQMQPSQQPGAYPSQQAYPAQAQPNGYQQGYPNQMQPAASWQQMPQQNPYQQQMWGAQQNPYGAPMQQGYQQYPQYQQQYQQPAQQDYPQNLPQGAGQQMPQMGQTAPNQGGYQPGQMPAASWQQNQAAPQQGMSEAAPQANAFSGLHISERGQAALQYLAVHEAVGPSNLMKAYGGSQPTWSRELKELEGMGLIKKDGQKYYLTEVGNLFLGSH